MHNLSDDWFLQSYRRNYYALVVGNGDPLFDQNVKMAAELGSKQIPHIMDVWEGFGHDWPWWWHDASYSGGQAAMVPASSTTPAGNVDPAAQWLAAIIGLIGLIGSATVSRRFARRRVTATP